MSRYDRQTAVFGSGAQDRLSAARVLVIGAGGLGAPVLQYLAGAGVGQLDIVDPDRVSDTNLHRQTLFATDQIGMYKAPAAAGAVARLNPDVSVAAHVAAFAPDTGEALVQSADLVLDCADSHAVSFAASDLCAASATPLITASVLGFSGYACGVCGSAPSLRALFPEPPDSAASCATAGVSGPVVGLVGAAQAQMALAQLTGVGEPPLGLMLRLDAGAWHFSRFRFDAAVEPPTTLNFVSPSTLDASDMVIELRDASEAPRPIVPHACRLLSGATPPRPAQGQRTVLACATGLRAWRLGQRLLPDWPGPIVLTADVFSNLET